MLPSHQFIFTSGSWIGQGKLSFSYSPTFVRFYTKWRIEESANDLIRMEQEIEQEGDADHLFNTYTVTAVTAGAFDIEISNVLLGRVKGHGVFDAKTIAWEFPSSQEDPREDGFSGFEVYEWQDNGDYMLHGEYCSGDLYRTIIDGRIWKKSK